MRSSRCSPRLSKLFDADGHALMCPPAVGRGRCRTVVPPGQVEAEVAVRLRTMTEWWTRCMSGVTTTSRSTRSSHSGRRTLPWLNIDVALSSTSKSQHRQGRRRGSDHADLDAQRQQDFERVEAHAGRDVEVQVGVVDPVQPPQEGHGVEHDVLEVDREVHGEEGKWKCHPCWRTENLEQSQPCVSQARASATTVVGKISRTRTVSRTTTPMLLGQRNPRRSCCPRRGAMISQAVKAAKTEAKAISRIAGS